MPSVETFVIAGLLALAFAFEWALGVYQNDARTRDDWIVELGSVSALGLVIRPGIVIAVGAAGGAFAPDLAGSVAWSLPVAGAAVLLSDDLLQYGYHRAAHRFDFLWRLHRAHHAAPHMGVTISYRNAFGYYVLMPNLWTTAAWVYLGLSDAVAIVTVLKLVIVMGSHSELRWDRRLYEVAALRPVAWLVERTISTPATHFAHHGLDESDGVSAPNGNFGNMFFIWDVLFGTAFITRKYPERFGLPGPKLGWTTQLLSPRR